MSERTGSFGGGSSSDEAIQTVVTPAGVASLDAPFFDESAPLLSGRYELLGLLGSGGMGSVYRARDTELDELVALKMLRKELIDAPGMLQRFRQEVKIARRVTHKNVARTFDIGEHAGEKFLTMELIDGQPLSALIPAEGAAPPFVVDVVCAICEGLAAAHEAGVVHRDLKPDNVLLAKDGRVVVTDFGIAHALADPSQGQTGGAPIGTPAYMSPEQVQGTVAIDPRADLYALGALAYEMLTGARAWQGASPFVVAAQRLTQPPPDPRARRPELPAALAEVVLRLMARRPEDRFPNALAAADAFRAARPERTPAPALQRRATSQPSLPRVVTNPGERTVAVLPFRNGGLPEDDYIAEGLTEDLTDVLSMTRGLRVRPRGMVKHHTQGGTHGDDPRALGRKLDVQVVVEGSVRRAGSGYRLVARVISVADGFQLWASRFDRRGGEILQVMDEVARAIAIALTAQLHAPAREALSDPIAIELYLRGRVALRTSLHSSDRLSEVVDLFEEALTRAPGDPTLLAGCATARARLAFFSGENARQAAELAREVAERAIAAAPESGEPWLALASVHLYIGDSTEAIRALRQTLSVAPSLARAHELLGRILLEAGLLEEATKRLQSAVALDPTVVEPRFDLARAHALLGDFQQADALLQQPVDEAPAEFIRIAMHLRMRLWRMPALGPAPWPEGDLGDGIAQRVYRVWRRVLTSGRIEATDIEDWEGTVAAAGGQQRLAPIMLQFYVESLTAAGEHERAFDPLKRSVELGFPDLGWMDRCPLLSPMRGDPRFSTLRATVEERARAVLDMWAR